MRVCEFPPCFTKGRELLSLLVTKGQFPPCLYKGGGSSYNPHSGGPGDEVRYVSELPWPAFQKFRNTGPPE